MQRNLPAIQGTLAERLLGLLLLSLRRDKGDPELLQLTLYLFLHLVPPQEPEDLASRTFPERKAADALAADVANIEIVLEALKHAVPDIRIQAVQLLTGLVRINRAGTDAALLSCRGALSRLVEVLDDTSEAVLSEALLMLRQLTLSNLEIRSLVAFQVSACTCNNIHAGQPRDTKPSYHPDLISLTSPPLSSLHAFPAPHHASLAAGRLCQARAGGFCTNSGFRRRQPSVIDARSGLD